MIFLTFPLSFPTNASLPLSTEEPVPAEALIGHSSERDVADGSVGRVSAVPEGEASLKEDS